MIAVGLYRGGPGDKRKESARWAMVIGGIGLAIYLILQTLSERS